MLITTAVMYICSQNERIFQHLLISCIQFSLDKYKNSRRHMRWVFNETSEHVLFMQHLQLARNVTANRLLVVQVWDWSCQGVDRRDCILNQKLSTALHAIHIITGSRAALKKVGILFWRVHVCLCLFAWFCCSCFGWKLMF